MKTLLTILFASLITFTSCENRRDSEIGEPQPSVRENTPHDRTQGNAPDTRNSAPHGPNDSPMAPTGAGGSAPTGTGS